MGCMDWPHIRDPLADRSYKLKKRIEKVSLSVFSGEDFRDLCQLFGVGNHLSITLSADVLRRLEKKVRCYEEKKGRNAQ